MLRHVLVLALLLVALAIGLLMTVDNNWWFQLSEEQADQGDPEGSFVVAFFVFLWVAPIVVVTYAAAMATSLAAKRKQSR